ncbi:MAG: CBS domain-containing protein [Geminicoccaceae bacterium]
MQAKDVMTTKLVTAEAETSVRDIAKLMLAHRISGIPIVDKSERVLGMVSEGDLMRRPESETERAPSWWLEAVFSPRDKAADYVKVHGTKAGDVMTRNVLTVDEDMPIRDVARLLEEHRFKRVPVVRDGKLVGIISRANLLHGLVAGGPDELRPVAADDRSIRETLLQTLADEAGINTAMVNVIVTDGVVQLWGLVDSAREKKAAQVAAETMAGVKSVENNLGQIPAWST